MQRLSIIVPLMGDLKRFEDTLVSVLENQPERSEVVVVLNGPYDDPYELRGEVKFVEAPQGADLVDCFACGLAASSAPVVHMIAAGFEATPGWADAALARFAGARHGRCGPGGGRSRPSRPDPVGRAALHGGRLDWPHRRRKAAWIGLPPMTAFFAAPNWRLPSIAARCWRRLRSCRITAASWQPQRIWPWPCARPGIAPFRSPRASTTATERIVRFRRRLAGRTCRRAAFPSLGGRFPAGNARGQAHAGLVAMECVQLPLRPSVLARLAGRLWATLGFGSPRTVAIGPQVMATHKGAVIRPPHFGAGEARPALSSRAAG